jgi:hypothetical protein
MGAKVCLRIIEMLMSGMIEECWLQYSYIALDDFNVFDRIFSHPLLYQVLLASVGGQASVHFKWEKWT